MARNNDYDYTEVAAVALAAIQAGERVSTTVATRYSITQPNARVLISKVRKAGFDIPYERLPLETGLPALVYERIGEPEPWMQYGACSTADPDLFFPKPGESLKPAKAICASCQCQKACLEYALRAGEKHGVWGGLSEAERRRLRRQMRVQAAA